MTAEADLRERLARATGGLAVAPGEDLAAADAVIDRYRAGRRRSAAFAATAVLVLVLGVAGRWFAGSGAPAVDGSPAPGADGSAWTDSPRGSLADDDAFLSTVRARPWEAVAGVPPVSARTVAFAGDVSGSRWALVVGAVQGELRGQWFTGPAGAAPRSLQSGGFEYRVLPGLPVGAVRPDATGATLLVVAHPGDDVQVSPAVTVDASGKVRRAFSSVDTRDGVAVIREAGANAAASLRYRVLRDGLLAGVGPSSPAVVDPAADGWADAPRRPSAGATTAAAFARALGHILTATGFGPRDVDPVLLWTGPVPAPAGATVQGTVLVTTMPSGALVTGTAAGPLPGAADGADALCGSVAAPAGTRPDDVVSVAGCEVTISGGTQRSFVISAPAGYDTVMLRSSEGRVLGGGPLVAGSGAVIDPGTVATAVLSGPGRSPLELAPADARHDALDTG